jgi:cell wall assembly regulator SMI1
MQKFTRALTREIVIGSERLAVTFDEGGLSLRPVGSRKPPHELSWAAVVCALTALPSGSAPEPDQIDRALQTLRGGAPTSAPRPLVTAPTGGIEELLARLDAWLKKERKRYHRGLLPGAREQINELAQALGRPVPDELADWLRWHNGQDEELIGTFVEGFNLMSVSDIIHTLNERKGEKGWNPAFVPILDDYQDDLVVVDTNKPGLPVREVWRGRDDHPEIATSMRGWLAALLADFESGRYVEDPERGEFIRGS